VGKLRALYATLKEDPHYSKAQQAWKAYDAAKDKIAGGREKAKELLAKQARSGERFSIPVPPARMSQPRTRQSFLPPRTRPRASCARSTGQTTAARTGP
jgi:hypothetical protein